MGYPDIHKERLALPPANMGALMSRWFKKGGLMISNFVGNKMTRKSAIFAVAFCLTCLAALMDVKSPDSAQPEGFSSQMDVKSNGSAQPEGFSSQMDVISNGSAQPEGFSSQMDVISNGSAQPEGFSSQMDVKSNGSAQPEVFGIQAEPLEDWYPPLLEALSDVDFQTIMQELRLLPADPQTSDLPSAEQAAEGVSAKQSEEQPAVTVMQPVTLTAPSGPVYDALGFAYLSDIDLSEDLQRYTYQRCQETGLEYEMVLAIMWRESRFQPHAVGVNSNGTKDSGLMQINDVNREWLENEHGISDLLDPYQNIYAGTAILEQFYSKYGEDQALMAYQYGEGGMLRKAAQGITTNEKTEMAKFKRDEYKLLREEP